MECCLFRITDLQKHIVPVLKYGGKLVNMALHILRLALGIQEHIIWLRELMILHPGDMQVMDGGIQIQ